MIKFEKVARFADADFNMPMRKTANSAGYDFEVAEDIIIEPFSEKLKRLDGVRDINALAGMIEKGKPVTLDTLKDMVKLAKAKPTLVSTGVKCYLNPDTYLELSLRSSSPLKYLLVLANSVGIIDADYADNPDNEGEIFFQVINLSNMPIQLKKGDIIGQGIIKSYLTTDDDMPGGDRTGGFGSTTN